MSLHLPRVPSFVLGAGLALLAAAVLALRSRLQFADALRESEQRPVSGSARAK